MVHKNTLKSVINLIAKRLKITCILVSHDPDDILPWADKILVMKQGRILQAGTPQKIYNEPVDEYTAGLFGNYNLLDPSEAQVFPKLEKKPKKSCFVRPEHFMLVGKSNGGVKGKVSAVNYLGSHDEVEVELPGTFITVKTATGEKQIGQTVFVAVDIRRVTYL
jgi:ABC-type Fe3+/spermidine/putrescine transport system ATPase subunit